MEQKSIFQPQTLAYSDLKSTSNQKMVLRRPNMKFNFLQMLFGENPSHINLTDTFGHFLNSLKSLEASNSLKLASNQKMLLL